VRDLKHQRDVASEVNTTMQKPNPKVAGTLENRIKVLLLLPPLVPLVTEAHA
jgi:hypothetical protein